MGGHGIGSLVPPGRLVRLGVVIDASNTPPAVTQAAVFAERAGLDTLWLMPLVAPPPATDEVLAVLAAAALRTSSLVLGAFLEAMPAEIPAALAGRLELTVPLGAVGPPPAGVTRIDSLVEGDGDAPSPPEIAVFTATTVAGRQGEGPEEGGPFGVVASCSIGRTTAEAWARAKDDPVFVITSHPYDGGIFGTLEECQQQVLALAKRGMVDLRCVVPSAPDLGDVIAQLSAVAAGTLQVLSIGGRSPDPPAPEGWGGRRR